MSNSPIPTFEWDDIREGSASSAFVDCLTRFGIFYLTDEISADAHQRASRVALDFFADSSDEAKDSMMTPVPGLRRGYSGLGSESTARSTNLGSYSDYAEAYSMGTDDNLFPTPEFEQEWTAYFNSLHAWSRDIASAVLAASGTYRSASDPMEQTDPVLRFRNYPEVPAGRETGERPRRMAPHYDLSIITLLYQTPCTNGFVSLRTEVEGAWVDLPTVPGAVLVQCGAVAPIVTQGAINAPRHEVVAPGPDQLVGSARTSAAFFLRPSNQFEFDVPTARSYGIDVSLKAERATFGEWVGANYTTMHTDPTRRRTVPSGV